MERDRQHVDILIVGAGLSGIGAAYHVKARLPGLTYAVLEARASLGGTWDLFRYPGVRSDSDMYTLGYSFRPWTNPKAIADGASILTYIRETAEAYGIDRHIRYQRKVERVDWRSDEGRWHVDVRRGESGELERWTCRFLFTCTGYYDYARGYTPDLPGRDRFAGPVVHPQHWPSDLTWEGKRVVVLGSGATAVTLVPELAKTAAHVTMLQRSPTYIMSRPSTDPVADVLRGRLPEKTAYSVTRLKNVSLGLGFFAFCRAFPRAAKKLLVAGVEKELGGAVDALHFTPRYDPWDQRLCLVPDGDLFRSLKEGRASVVTGTIDTFTETGLLLEDGRALDADIVVTATGLELLFLGGARMEIDGKPAAAQKRMVYRGCMLEDVPNFAFAVGYTNASWTLKCDLASTYVCRVLAHLDAKGLTWAKPHRNAPVDEAPLLDFTSGYVARAKGRIPPQGSRAPWKLHQNWFRDRALMGRGPLDDGELSMG